jgi:hypothetical protein
VQLISEYLQGTLSVIFCIPSNIQSLIDFFSFVAWIFYGLTFFATLCCKFTKKEVHRVINVSEIQFSKEEMSLVL